MEASAMWHTYDPVYLFAAAAVAILAVEALGAAARWLAAAGVAGAVAAAMPLALAVAKAALAAVGLSEAVRAVAAVRRVFVWEIGL